MSIPEFKHKNANLKLAKSKFNTAFVKMCRKEFYKFWRYLKLVKFVNSYEFLNGTQRVLNLWSSAYYTSRIIAY